jgi:hypothetical protein
MKTQFFKCLKCDGVTDCIYCGGTGELMRETWDTEDRQRHMSKVGSEQGPKNHRGPWTNRFVAKEKTDG